MTRVLVVDDKEMMRDSVATMLSRKGHGVVVANGGTAALEKLASSPCDAVITDLQMPEMTGVELLKAIREIDEQIPVILMTAYGTVETAVEAMKLGAYDYITKPFSGDELINTIERALERGRLVKENQILKVRGTPAGSSACGREHEMVGGSESLVGLRLRLRQIAESNSTVLVTGESGTGKEVASRWIHEHSPRVEGAFLAINCAALSPSLLESELFGHEKGAFTGADKMRKGRFELADGGTLLLDEISEIAPGNPGQAAPSAPGAIVRAGRIIHQPIRGCPDHRHVQPGPAGRGGVGDVPAGSLLSTQRAAAAHAAAA